MVTGISEKAVFNGFARPAARARSGPLTLIRNHLHPTGELRVAFAVPRRVGPAVVRNRLRRQLRAVVDTLSAEGVFSNGTHLIVVGPGAKGSSFAQLRTWLVNAIDRMPAVNGGTVEN